MFIQTKITGQTYLNKSASVSCLAMFVLLLFYFSFYLYRPVLHFLPKISDLVILVILKRGKPCLISE